nr:glycosyltransferase [uncultured Thiodictyon sp.]
MGATIPSASVPYYLDLSEFLKLPRSRMPLDPAPVRFFTAAQMIARKGIDVLVGACARLPATGWTLTLAGEGPLRGALEVAFRRHWGADQVIFLGEIPYAERAAAFDGVDVFVFPSRWDGWGVAPIEAMAAGLPVIATDQVMSMREFLREDESGFVIPSEDAVALAERMGRFIAHPERIPVMGHAARVALADYRPDLGAARLVEFLVGVDQVIDSARPADAERRVVFDEVPTWKHLTQPTRIGRRTVQCGRALAKRAVIDVGMSLPWRHSAPRGHRILVYHLVLREDRNRFREHLSLLRDHYRVVTVRDLVQGLGKEDECPSVAISFDDGFRVLMSDALELLEEQGVKASFYVPTDFIDLAGDQAQAASFSLRAHYYQRPLQPMAVDDLRLLRSLGHEIGSHGVSHLGLDAVSCTRASRELKGSRDRLSAWLGEAPVGFAYPYGKVESTLGQPCRWVADAGYGYAVTLRRGTVHMGTDRFLLPREHVEGHWRVRDLRYFLSR